MPTQYWKHFNIIKPFNPEGDILGTITIFIKKYHLFMLEINFISQNKTHIENRNKKKTNFDKTT